MASNFDINEIAISEMLLASSRYTIHPSNFERVVSLVVDDIVEALRPVIEENVRRTYSDWFNDLGKGRTC